MLGAAERPNLHRGTVRATGPVISVLLLLLASSIGAAQTGTSIRADTSSSRAPRRLTAPVHVCAGGDVTLGTNLDPKWARYAADTLWQQFGLRADPDSIAPLLKPFLSGADLVLLNVEGAIGAGPAPQKCGPRSTNCFAFRQPPNAAAALRRLADSNVAIVGNLANNHAHDAGPAGRDTTIARLTQAHVFVTGVDTLATPVVLASGDTIGVLGFYTDSTTPDARDVRAVRRHVARAAEQFGTVIVTMHLGAEGPTAQRTRNATERFLERINRGNPVAFADAAFAGGATIVIGHGPHVLRAAEWRGDRLVFYSLGNLLSTVRSSFANRRIAASSRARRSTQRNTSRAPSSARPCKNGPGFFAPDSTKRALTLIDSLSALDFPRSGATVDSTVR